MSKGGSDKSAKILDNESMFGLAEECRMLMTSDDNFLIRCGVDGIAFLSLDADVKEDLVGDTDALQGLYKGKLCYNQILYFFVNFQYFSVHFLQLATETLPSVLIC